MKIMKVLALHNKYLNPGGEDKSHIAEVNLLRKNGHMVNEYILDNKSINSEGKLRTAAKTIWCSEAYRRIKEELGSDFYDLVIVQNFFPLISPALFYASASIGVPVFQFLRNYRLLCLNAFLFREGRACEDCLGKTVPWPGVMHGCYRDSRIGSLVVASMISIHKALGTWDTKISQYIALTDFSKSKMIQGGLPAEKISVRPNFLDTDPGIGSGEGGYALFTGRLSSEKGISVLLKAWKTLPYQLNIVGDGPFARDVETLTDNQSGLNWLGYLSGSNVIEKMKSAYCLIMPSLLYENFPRVIIESFAVGTPVIASRLGSMQEIIRHEETGLLYNPGDPFDLAEKVTWAYEHPKEMADMRKAARAEYERKYHASQAYERFMDIYSQVTHIQ